MAHRFSGEIFDNPDLSSPAVRLAYMPEDHDQSMVAEISPYFGSNLYKWQVGDNDLIYCDNNLLTDRDWTGTPVLWPIPNRVRGKEFKFEGHTHSLQDVKRKRGNETLIHGFVDDLAWNVSEPVVTDEHASVRTWIDIDPNNPAFRFYPYLSRLALTFMLHEHGMKVTYEVENNDDKNMPYGFALHPYFATLSGLDHTLVTLPAQSIMEADEELLPSGRLISMGEQGYDLRAPTPVGELALDHVFTDLPAGKDPAITYQDQGLEVTLASSEESTHVVLYTLEAADSGFICFENQTGSTDMINLHTQAVETGDEDLKKAAHLMVAAPHTSQTGYIDYQIRKV